MSRQTARANSRVLRGVLAGHLRVWPLSRYRWTLAGPETSQRSRDLTIDFFDWPVCRIDFFDWPVSNRFFRPEFTFFFLTPDLPPSLSLGCSKGKL